MLISKHGSIVRPTVPTGAAIFSVSYLTLQTESFPKETDRRSNLPLQVMHLIKPRVSVRDES